MPVAIKGARDAMKKGSLIIRPGPRDRQLRRADRDGRPDAGRSRRADRARRGRPSRAVAEEALDMEMLDVARPDDGVFVCGGDQPLRDRRDPRASPAATAGSRCRRSTRSSTTTGSSAARWCSTSSSSSPTRFPWVDSVWDAVHTVIRPVGGAAIAVATLGESVAGDRNDGRAARRRARRQHPLQQEPARACSPTPARSRSPTGPSASARTSSSSASACWR